MLRLFMATETQLSDYLQESLLNLEKVQLHNLQKRGYAATWCQISQHISRG